MKTGFQSLAKSIGLILPLGTLGALLFAPIVLEQKALYWGTPALQFVPWWKLSWEAIRGGEWPLWNPYLGMGAPLLANYQSGVFYPPHWVYFLLYQFGGTPMMAWGMALMVGLHLFWSGLGMALLLRRLGGSQVSQQVGGLAFGFCGYLVSRAGFLSINATVAWLPWIIWSLTPSQVGEKGTFRWKFSKRSFITVVLLSMQWLAGHAQLAWYTLILALLWLGFWALVLLPSSHGDALPEGWWAPIRMRLKNLGNAYGNFLLTMILSAGLCAAQLLPTLEYLWISQRGSAVDAGMAMTYSFWPWRLLTFLAADVFGNPASGDYWGYANYWEDAVYLGLLPFVLAMYMGFRALRKVSRKIDTEGDGSGKALRFTQLSRFSWLLFLFALILALGRNLPVFPWLYQHIPTFDLFQAPTRFMIWGEFALSLMAGLAIDIIQRPARRGLYWTRLATAGAFSIFLGAGLTHQFLPEIHPTFIRSFMRLGWLGFAVGLLILTNPSPDVGRPGINLHGVLKHVSIKTLWNYAVIALLIVDLYLAGKSLNPGIDLEFYAPYYRGRINLEHRVFMPESVEYALKFERYFRFDRFQTHENWLDLRNSWLPNMSALDLIASANNFDPILPAHYAAWMERLEALPEDVRNVWLDWMDVGYVVPPITQANDTLELTARTGAQRFWWSSCANFIPHEGMVLDLLSNPASMPRLYLIEEPRQSARDEAPCQPVEWGEVVIREETFNHLRFSVVTEAPGYLMISDTWMPGWSAIVDGQAAHVYRANFLFRAIYLEAGNHEVQMVYDPIAFRLGIWISALSLLSFVGLWFYRILQGRRS